MLPHGMQSDVAQRIALMRPVSPEVIRDIEVVLERKINLFVGREMIRTGGIDAVVDVLSNLDRGTEKNIIEALEEEDPELAEEIKKRMFVFEDIVLLDDSSIRKVIEESEISDLAKAIKGTGDEVKEKFLKN